MLRRRTQYITNLIWLVLIKSGLRHRHICTISVVVGGNHDFMYSFDYFSVKRKRHRVPSQNETSCCFPFAKTFQDTLVFLRWTTPKFLCAEEKNTSAIRLWTLGLNIRKSWSVLYVGLILNLCLGGINQQAVDLIHCLDRGKTSKPFRMLSLFSLLHSEQLHLEQKRNETLRIRNPGKWRHTNLQGSSLGWVSLVSTGKTCGILP